MRYWIFFLASLQTALFADHFLTFIVPCYNCEAWVEEAIGSILDQKNLRCPFEIVCTDDGSTDGTYAVLRRYQQTFPALRLFRHEKNRGAGACRNTCVSHAQGDLIFCLDADNVLAPNSVQTLVDQLDKEGDDAVAFGSIRYFAKERLVTGLTIYRAPGEQCTLEWLMHNAETPPWSGNYLYTKASFLAAGGYPEKVGAIDTFAFGFLQLLKGCKMSYVPHTYYFHRYGIISYSIREGTHQRIAKTLCKFLLGYQDLLTPKTIKTLKKQLDLIQKGEVAKHELALFSEQKLQLRKTE